MKEREEREEEEGGGGGGEGEEGGGNKKKKKKSLKESEGKRGIDFYSLYNKCRDNGFFVTRYYFYFFFLFLFTNIHLLFQ
jgi:hypothetical protein